MIKTLTATEIFANLPEDFEQYIALESLCNAMGLPPIWDFDEELEMRFKQYSIVRWLCTDTFVGTNAITFDDKPFAITHQSARKSSIEWKFMSMDLAYEVREVLTEDLTELDMQDPYEGFPIFYNLNYGGSLLDFEGFHEDRAARVVKTWDYSGFKHPASDVRPARDIDSGKMDRVVIRYEDTGEEKEIYCAEFRLPLRLKVQS